MWLLLMKVPRLGMEWRMIMTPLPKVMSLKTPPTTVNKWKICVAGKRGMSLADLAHDMMMVHATQAAMRIVLGVIVQIFDSNVVIGKRKLRGLSFNYWRAPVVMVLISITINYH